MLDILFQRRHREYIANESRWKRNHDAYSGGAEYIDQALIRHVSEIELEFSERRQRAYYFNYPRAIAQRITQYALATEPVRRFADPELLEDWSRTGLRTGEVMRQLSTMLNVYGRAWLLVEMPSFSGETTLKRAKQERLRPFVRSLSPFAVTDWSAGEDGRLQWAIVAEVYQDSADPLEPVRTVHRRRLYTRDRWRLFESVDGEVQEVASGENHAGQVPLIPVTEPDGFGLDANHWFEDVVRISDAILNNESEAQMNTVKQMFGMLVVSDAFARGAQKLAGREQRDSFGNFAATVARSAAVIESVEEKGISRFISPSGVETSTIRAENTSLKQELYDVVGMAIQGNSRFAQTAESKSWDFQNASRFLIARAELLEQAELNAWRLMSAYDGNIRVPEVIYNRRFAIQDLAASIEGLLKLAEIDAGPAYRKAIHRAALEQLDGISSVSEAEKLKILSEIEEETSQQTAADLPEAEETQKGDL